MKTKNLSPRFARALIGFGVISTAWGLYALHPALVYLAAGVFLVALGRQILKQRSVERY